jgi:O-acetyl-ADP-ribose deacetylase (regulator of RNase III)
MHNSALQGASDVRGVGTPAVGAGAGGFDYVEAAVRRAKEREEDEKREKLAEAALRGEEAKSTGRNK